jgi:hypothetical protein
VRASLAWEVEPAQERAPRDGAEQLLVVLHQACVELVAGLDTERLEPGARLHHQLVQSLDGCHVDDEVVLHTKRVVLRYSAALYKMPEGMLSCAARASEPRCQEQVTDTPCALSPMARPFSAAARDCWHS